MISVVKSPSPPSSSLRRPSDPDLIHLLFPDITVFKKAAWAFKSENEIHVKESYNFLRLGSYYSTTDGSTLIVPLHSKAPNNDEVTTKAITAWHCLQA